MRLAICDDDEQALFSLRALLVEYGAIQGIELSCQTFSSGSELLFGMKGGEYDAVLLDVLMPGFTGIQTAQELRNLDQTVKILFLTSTPEFAVESYSVGAFHYLLKPATAKTLFPLLDAVHAELSMQEEGLLLRSRTGLVRVPFSRLEYVDVMNKTVSFHLTDGSMKEIPATLADFEDTLLSRPEFRKVHRSYLINLRHVQAVNTKEAVTHTGHTIPIARGLQAKIKEDYLSFLFQDKGTAQYTPPTPAPPKPSIPERKPVCTDGSWRLLLVDDEPADLICWADVLRAHGCVVETAEDETTALRIAALQSWDCVLLDVRLPGSGGFALCSHLGQLTGAPVVFLSCLTDTDSQLQGFFAGGVDYITKDTPPELFWAKVESRLLLSRAGRTQMHFGPLLLDLSKREATLDEREFLLTPTEFDLLWSLATHIRQIFTPEEIFRAVWGQREWDGGQTVQVHMSRLRRKLEKAYPAHVFIETIWGEGYRFVPVESDLTGAGA